MTRIYLSLGSNVNREQNIRTAIAALKEQFGELQCSSVYQSSSIERRGADYFNLVVTAETSLDPEQLQQQLKTIEKQLHRDHTSPEKVTIDIDLLLFGNRTEKSEGLTIPHPDIKSCQHVLVPLAELAPDLILPDHEITLRELLSQQQFSSENLQQIDFSPDP